MEKIITEPFRPGNRCVNSRFEVGHTIDGQGSLISAFPTKAEAMLFAKQYADEHCLAMEVFDTMSRKADKCLAIIFPETGTAGNITGEYRSA